MLLYPLEETTQKTRESIKMTKKKAYIVYYGWFDGYLVHGVFTDLDEAKSFLRHEHKNV